MLKSVGFDLVILETVGVGQSEVQVASVADLTILVLVPEAGDDIQMMKSGLFEVATIFVVNKSDRPEAKKFAYHLQEALGERNRPGQKTNIIETIATTGEGVDALYQCIQEVYGHLNS
jgi:LAO/AO transport system kinase